MKILLLFLLVASSAHGTECDEPGDQSLSSLVMKKCLSDDIMVSDLNSKLNTPKKTLEFCKKNCNNKLISNLQTKPEPTKEEKLSKADATLNEFQKSLTFLTIDLMRMRSTYALDFDAKPVAEKCNFKKKLVTPSCLLGKDLESFKAKISDIQNSLASEMSIILSGKNNGNGILIRKPASCHISDTDASNSQMRYSESILTPVFIAKLQNLKIPENKSVIETMEGSKDLELESSVYPLMMHPVFKNILNDKKKLTAFLTKAKSLKTSESIIETIYSKEQMDDLSKNLENRCSNLFQESSKFLNDVYCKDSSNYAADDLKSMEFINGKKFLSLNESEVEIKLKAYCSELNTKNSDFKGFSHISNTLNGMNDKSLIGSTFEDFKNNAYDGMYKSYAEAICLGMNDKECSSKPDSTNCKIYDFYKKSKESPAYIQLAKASNDNINTILQSLVGDRLPQKDGKVDTASVAILKSEGILPGGDTSSRPPQQTAAAFNKTVNSAAPQTQSAAKPAAIASPASKPEAPEAQPSYAQSAARDSDPEEDPSSSQSDSPVQKQSRKKPNSKFSNLSDDEQQRIMDMMKRSKKAGGKTPATASSDDESSSEDVFADAGSAMASIGSQAAGASMASVAQKAASAGAAAGKKAVLDPTKKSSSLNEAMVDANANRQLAGSGSGASSTGAQVSISKSAANENEIKIKVAEAELSQVNEFKEKLKVLLNAHSQEISVAGAGEKFVVKLNNFEINVVFNKQLGTYEALCKDASIPKDYLKTISTYFNVTLKGSSGKREALVNTLKQ